MTSVYRTQNTQLHHDDALNCYPLWESPRAIISDGAFGIEGFDGDTKSERQLIDWYEPHIKAWSEKAEPGTTLWFWCTEIGWAYLHHVLVSYGWTYIRCNIWNKGMGHLTGRLNTGTLRSFPAVTEVCAHYTKEPKVFDIPIRDWMVKEWKRTGLRFSDANEACGVKNAASRKYLTLDHNWYFPPYDMMCRLVDYANRYGDPSGRPYFSFDGKNSLDKINWEDYRPNKEVWSKLKPKFECPFGWTNVWSRSGITGKERVKLNGKAVHPNQKPLDITSMLIKACTDEGDVVWDPFGGVLTSALACEGLKRTAYSSELGGDYFKAGIRRFNQFSLRKVDG